MGKATKYIYGTMDNDDAEEIYAHSKNLDKNMKNVIVATNEQAAINNNLIKIAEEIKNHTNKKTGIINNYREDMKTMINRIAKTEEDIRQAFELYLTIQKLNRLVEKLSDIILMSRLNILAHDIFTKEEVEKYNISIEIIPYMNTNVMIEGRTIIFVLIIPQFTNEKFHETLIIPFPNDKKEQLDFPITRILISKNDIYEFKDDIIKQKQLRKETRVLETY